MVREMTKLVLVHSQAADSQQLAYLGDVLGWTFGSEEFVPVCKVFVLEVYVCPVADNVSFQVQELMHYHPHWSYQEPQQYISMYSWGKSSTSVLTSPVSSLVGQSTEL